MIAYKPEGLIKPMFDYSYSCIKQKGRPGVGLHADRDLYARLRRVWKEDYISETLFIYSIEKITLKLVQIIMLF